nr:MAG TPA: hypothetical protein [Caudoviricetes sp.]
MIQQISYKHKAVCYGRLLFLIDKGANLCYALYIPLVCKEKL